MKRLRMVVTVALVLTFLAGLMACATPAGRSVGGVVDDATITSRVKAKLFADDRLSGFAIGVDTFKGEVTLTGGVNTEDDRRHATEVAQRIQGVKNVNNFLMVK